MVFEGQVAKVERRFSDHGSWIDGFALAFVAVLDVTIVADGLNVSRM
jgi:hypothetical protein